MKLGKFIILDSEGRRIEIIAPDAEQAARVWKYDQPGVEILSVEPSGEAWQVFPA